MKKGKKKAGRGWRRDWELYLMALPCMVAVIIFNYIPMGGIILAFKSYNFSDGVWKSPWVGFDNFRFFFESGVAGRLVFNTVFLNTLFALAVQILGILAALLLNEIFKYKIAKVYQSVLFFPHFISWVIVGYFAYAFLNADNGLINNLLGSVGIEGINWYAQPEYWPAILTAISVWKGLGYFTIIYLAGMVTVNPELYEAVRLDGGNKYHEMRYITFPMIKPLIYTNVFLALGRMFYANFDFFNNVVRNTGQIMSTTDVIDTYVMRSVLVTGDFNMAAAAGLFQGICGFILILGSNWLVDRFDKENALF